MSRIRWRLHWSRTCWYGLCPDCKTWNVERARVLRRNHLDIGKYSEHAGLTTLYKTPDKRYLVTLGDRLDDDPVTLVSTLAHEAVHVVRAAHEAMGENSAGEETLAYEVGVVVRHLFEDLCVSERFARFKEKWK